MTSASPLSKRQIKALRRAASRETGHICPIIGLHGNAEQMVIEALERRGFIERGVRAPRITEAGREALRALGEA